MTSTLIDFLPSALSFRATPRKLVAEPVSGPRFAINSEYILPKSISLFGYTPVGLPLVRFVRAICRTAILRLSGRSASRLAVSDKDSVGQFLESHFDAQFRSLWGPGKAKHRLVPNEASECPRHECRRAYGVVAQSPEDLSEPVEAFLKQRRDGFNRNVSRCKACPSHQDHGFCVLLKQRTKQVQADHLLFVVHNLQKRIMAGFFANLTRLFARVIPDRRISVPA